MKIPPSRVFFKYVPKTGAGMRYVQLTDYALIRRWLPDETRTDQERVRRDECILHSCSGLVLSRRECKLGIKVGDSSEIGVAEILPESQTCTSVKPSAHS